MAIFQINAEESGFPNPRYADKSGILAVGGDLSPERLFDAYSKGIFPWYDHDDPIIWWSPDPRFVLFPEKIKISKSMRQVLKRNVFTITFDRAFEQVIRGCRKPREGQDGTWITHEMFDAYIKLHHTGIAHSVEAWKGDHLAGGLYGISLGGCFFGESMFSKENNSSKAALITLAMVLKDFDFDIIDCQVYTAHLESMGAEHIPRKEFLSLLEKSIRKETLIGNWRDLENYIFKVR